MQYIRRRDLKSSENGKLKIVKRGKRITKFVNRNNDAYFVKSVNMEKKADYLGEEYEKIREVNDHLRSEKSDLIEKCINLTDANGDLNKENFAMSQEIEELKETVKELNDKKEDAEMDLSKRKNYEIYLWERISQLADENASLRRQLEICKSALMN